MRLTSLAAAAASLLACTSDRGDGSARDAGMGVACGPTTCGAGEVCCTSCEGARSCSPGGCPGIACFDARVLDAGSDAVATDAPEIDAPVEPDAGPIVCSGSSPSFPTWGHGCAADADCEIGRHMVDCCGTMAALGVLSTERAAFDAAEATCESMYPPCGCASRPTTAEDGRDETAGTIAVRCAAGECDTHVP
jgi:hypothetical protein